MRYFSKNFSFLIESMKSDTTITEKKFKGGEKTASGDTVKKIEGKQGRFEKKFLTGGDFNMNLFVDALELLRDQIVAESNSMINTASSKSYGFKYHKPILASMDSLRKNVLDLIKTAYSEGKAKGKKLDPVEHSETIDTFREQYTEYVEKYEDLSKEWENAKVKDIKERPTDQANKELEDKIKEVRSIFDSARQLLIKSATDVVQGAGGKPEGSIDGKINLESTIKQRQEAYTGKEAETIKGVKKLIYDKFKKYDQLASTPDWKIVFSEKNIGSPTLRANTANVIKAIKVGLSKTNTELASDKTGDITQAFVKALTELKESKSIETNKIISFDAFMEARITEQFDVEAAINSLGGSGKKEESKVSSKDVSDALVDSKPEKKKEVKEETIEEMIKKAKEEAKKELKLEDLVDDLKKIKGVTIVDGFDSSKSYKVDPKNPYKGYLAKCKGLIFFEKGVCLRTYDGMLGYYNPETGYYKGKDGWREKISDLIKNQGAPKKYTVLTKKLLEYASSSPTSEAKKYITDLLTYRKSTIKAILKSAKWQLENGKTRVDVLVKIRERSMGTSDTAIAIKKFYDKNKDLFKELL